MRIADNLFIYPWTSFTENNCNTYILGDRGQVMIDPGHKHLFTNVEQGLAKDGLSLDAIEAVLFTHSHPDHFEAIELFMDRPGVTLGMNSDEEKFLAQAGPMFAQMMGLPMPEYRLDMDLVEGELEVGGIKLQVFLTPGHSPGHVCLYWPEMKVLFSGDLIFNQGVGRTDFPGGDGELLKASIKRMAELDIELILSGHGEPVNGKQDVARNFELIEKTYFDWI